MTEVSNGIEQSQGSTQAINNQVVNQQSESRMFNQSQVDDIVKRVKADAVETYRRIQSEQPQYAQQKYGDPTSYQTSGISQEEIRKLAAQEAQKTIDSRLENAHRNAQERDMQRIANEFITKINTAKSQFDDLDDLTKDVDFREITGIVELTNSLDNTGAVVRHLLKNPTHAIALENSIRQAVANGLPPRLALKELQKISQSLKINDEASNVKVPNEPLSQMKPSSAGTDNGRLEIKDYKRRYKV